MNPRSTHFLFLLLLAPLCLTAQNAKLPVNYTVAQTVDMNGKPMKTVLHRKGDVALRVFYVEGSNTDISGMQYYDLKAHKDYNWSTKITPLSCSVGTFSGDWGDPFEEAQSMQSDLNELHARQIGTETVAGIKANLLEVNAAAPIGKLRIWIDPATGLILKEQSFPDSSPPLTVSEILSISLATPPDALFKLPNACNPATNPNAPLTESEQIAKITADDANNYSKAIYGPGSNNSCNVTFVAMGYGMKRISNPYQVAVDLTRSQNNSPSYTINLSKTGHATFQGGGLHEIFAPNQDGVFHIPNAPASFDLELAFGGDSGGAAALIYRQCTGPDALLVYVIKNPAKVSDGGEFLWVKSGKNLNLLK